MADEFLDALHTEYGARLLRKWNLPEIYCEVCQEHHQARYDTSNILLVAVRLANNFPQIITTTFFPISTGGSMK